MTTCTCDLHSAWGNTTVLTVDQTYASSTASQTLYVHSANGSMPYVIFAEGATNSILGKTYTSGGIGVIGQDVGAGTNGTGVRGTSNNGYGMFGAGYTYGVYGQANGTNGIGVYGYAYVSGGVGISAYGYSKAATFNGPVDVSGYLTKSGGGFRIDHPADPENKYLNHEFVESDRAKNIYDGELSFDTSGKAIVEMPSWYKHVSSSGRLLVMPHDAAPSLATKKISEGKWEVSGGTAGMTADYFVISTRSDKWAKDNHPGVEIEKSVDKKGFFKHPEQFGFGKDKHEEPNFRNIGK
jgi:hypothetical protein